MLLASAASPLLAQSPETTQLSLEQAIGLALGRDANIDRAERSAEIAKLQVENAKSNYLPNASVTVSANQSATGNSYRSGDQSFRRGLAGNFVGTLSADVSMPVDISGSIGRQVDAARLRQEIAELGKDRAKRNALVDVQIAYLSALEAQQMVTIDEAIVASLVGLRKRATTRLPSVLPFFDVEFANALEQLRNSRAGADQAEDALKLALRLPFELDLKLTSPLPDYDRLSRSDHSPPDLDKMVEVETSKRALEAAQLGIEQAKDYRRPSLRLGAYATQTLSGRFIDEAGRTTNRDYGLNVSLNLPLFNYDAGRADNSVRTMELMRDQARADLETTRLGATLSIRQARQALGRAEKRLTQLPDPKAAAQALASATTALLKKSRRASRFDVRRELVGKAGH